RKQGRPVVVDFTARWCLTCNTIVKGAFENPSVRDKIKQINALPLLADFTRRPPDIKAELNHFGRDGVPMVLVYPSDAQQPPQVFDLVTPSSLLDALDKARTKSTVADAKPKS